MTNPELQNQGRGTNASPDHQREIERLSRLYASLSQINQAIVYMPSRAGLFGKVCDALVEHGGFRMAWIGWEEPLTHELVPVAHAGHEDGYLQLGAIGTPDRTADRAAGRGPSGIAFCEGRPFICNDLLTDAATEPSWPEVQRRDYRAAATFPIRANDRIEGTLTVYADAPGFFQDKEVVLLTEAAANISFALANFAREEERQRIEALAERERAFASNLMESMPGIFYLCNVQGEFLRWNRNFERLSGYSGDEIAKMRPFDFFNSADEPRVRARVVEVFQKGDSSVEASFVAKDQTATPFYFTGNRIQFDGATCLVGVGVDITERKRVEGALRRSEERYRSTLDNILEGCQLIGFDWRYLYLNGAAAKQNRRPNEELLGKLMPDMWPGIEETPVFAMLRRCMEERVAQHHETEFVFPDGSKGWFDVRAQPVPEGIFVLSIDISERKRAETTLRELNESLEKKVAERTRDLETARERAESADRLKSAFLATMSHELRTPLNSIIGFTGIILQGMAGPLTDEQNKQLGMVRGSARHLLELINDVLDISKIEAGQLKVHCAPFDLQASVERMAATVRPLAESKGVTLRVLTPAMTEPWEIDSDRRRVEQILLNLISNAIKFTDQGGITITVAVVGAAVRIQVADTGIGIKSEAVPLLFRPFHQVDSGLERQHEGTGLGLAICRRLAELLGGSIHVESEWGHGSAFIVTLPLHPPVSHSASANSAQAHP